MIGAIVAIAAGAALVRSSLQHGDVYLLQSDGASFAAIARDPFGNAATLHHFGHRIDGTAYRFGRMLVPFLAWLLAAGRAPATTVTLPIVVALGWGLTAACAVELCRRRGKSGLVGLAALLTPFAFIWARTPYLVSDPLVTGMVLLVYLADTDGRRTSSRVVAALTILAREAATLAFLPLMWRDVRERGRRAAYDWGLVVAPYAAWCVWLRFRTGFFPFLDPATSRRDALTLPLSGILRVFPQHLPAGPAFEFAVLVATVALALYVLRTREWFPMREGALCLSVLILCYGTSVWVLWAEALRVMSTAQTCLLLALVAGTRVSATAGREASVTPRSRTGTA